MRLTAKIRPLFVGAALLGAALLTPHAYAGDKYERQALKPSAGCQTTQRQPVSGKVTGKVFLPPSLEPGSCTPQQILSVKHLDVINASLKSAQANLLALYDLSASVAAYDGAHATLLLDNVQKDFSLASEHVSHLGQMATGDFSDAMPSINREQKLLSTVDGRITALRAAIKANDVARVHALTGQLIAQYDDTWSSFSVIASNFSYDTTLKTPVFQAGLKTKTRKF